MRRWGLLLVVLWAASGCVELDVWLKDKPAPVTDPAAGAAPQARVRVRINPEDVTEQNARQALEALREELDRTEFDQRAAPNAGGKRD